jgi:diguanylate cyclase (GGDEF)-like protein
VTRKVQRPKIAPAIPLSETLPGLPEQPTVVRRKSEGETEAAPAQWALVAYAGSALGRVFPLPPGVTLLGRATTTGIALLDDEVSRQHAQVRLEGGQVQVEDLGSTNGTRVNGLLIQGAVSLQVGDRLGVGTHVLKLVCMDALERTFHETLLDLSTKDPLTGLANRGNTLVEFQNRFGLSLRYDRPLSVVVCDLDFFKAVNDTYGHGAGDLVLHSFGERLLKSLRESDLAGRIGGEEFLVILPETDLAGAVRFAERLRHAVADMPMVLPNRAIEVTCSLGVAERLPVDQEPGQLLARADAALYGAKAGGRNRVCIQGGLG